MDLSERAIDALVPSRALRPTTTEEVAAVIGAAHRAREAVVLWGGGTRIGVGDAPARYDIALDMGGVRGVVEHSAADLVCTVRAGTTLAELASALAPAGQRWPVDAPLPERATVGGTIASAAPAASRLRHQHVRDWVIGCEAVLGDGTRARAGGRVVKNVTGYDLTRLYSGTYGTLAALTEVSLKLVALDERALTLRLRDSDSTRLGDIALALRETLPLEAIVLSTIGGPALYIRAAGGVRAVERAVREALVHGRFEDVPDGAWAELLAAPAREAQVARLAVPPGREVELLGEGGHAYVGTGIAFTLGERSDDELRGLRSRCEAAGGALILERATAERKRELGVWGRSTSEGATARDLVVRRLKERFDPHGVLAPGRFRA